MNRLLKILSDFIKKIAFDEYKTTISVNMGTLDLERRAEYNAETKTITINHMFPEGMTAEDLYFILLHELAHIPPPEGRIRFSESLRLEKKYKDHINNLKSEAPEQAEIHNVIFFKEYERLKRKYAYQKFLDFSYPQTRKEV